MIRNIHSVSTHKNEANYFLAQSWDHVETSWDVIVPVVA